ncbi:MAG: alpha/beta fold hydrolase [Paracoccaceae bacterium]|nr:alpha/beta fold hydrolase [Paracoccaceae bacterium]
MSPIVRQALLAAAVTALAGAAFAETRDIRIDTPGGAVAATLETPEGGPAPVVLMLHGFGSTRDELTIPSAEEGVFVRAARVLAEAGYASLRVDFRGSGESDGAWEDTTFSGQIADALAAIEMLEASDAVDGSRLAILGWSQGALVGAHAAAASEAVDGLVLLSPVTIPSANFTNMFGAEAVFEAIAAETDTPVTLALPWGGETTLKGAYFDEMLTTSTAGALAGFDGPLLVFIGSNDTLIEPQPGAGEMLVSYHGGEGELVTLEMDHVFNIFATTEVLDNDILPRLVGWLDAAL